MGSTISNNKKIDSIITDLGFTKENLTNELQVVYNKYKKLQDDNNLLENINNKYIKTTYIILNVDQLSPDLFLNSAYQYVFLKYLACHKGPLL